MRQTILRPGLLVSLKSRVSGGVSYRKEEIDPEHREGASTVATWQTTRQIEDAEEHARAVVARGAARSVITRVCCPSEFGLLCLTARADELADAIADARTIADRHNATARLTRVEVFVVTGTIADNDTEAARAIASEVRGLLAAMEAGIKAGDPDAIRDAATKARSLSGMLTDDTKAKVSAAIAEVRAVARDIVKRAAESGETAASVVEGLKLEALASARFAVLDMDAPAETGEHAAIPGRAVDFEPSETSTPMESASAAPAPNLELF